MPSALVMLADGRGAHVDIAVATSVRSYAALRRRRNRRAAGNGVFAGHGGAGDRASTNVGASRPADTMTHTTA